MYKVIAKHLDSGKFLVRVEGIDRIDPVDEKLVNRNVDVITTLIVNVFNHRDDEYRYIPPATTVYLSVHGNLGI